MSFDPASLFVGIFIGIVGFAVFLYGKRQSRAPHLIGGIALMAFPYFVSGIPLTVGIAVAVLGLLALSVKLGL